MFHIKPSAENLNSHLENQDERGHLTDTRLAKKNKNLRKQQEMPATLDQELRKYFGFGKRQFKNIVNKPGVKFGFKLINYIHPSDSVTQINKILREIAVHIEYTKFSPVKKVFNENFKEELRTNFYTRHPKKYLIKLHIGAVFQYTKKDGTVTKNSNRHIYRDFIEKVSPKEIKSLTKVFPINVEIEGIDDTIGVFGINDVLYEKIEENINLRGSASKILDLWLEEKPIIIEHSQFTKNQFIELQDELLERASVLSDNFL